MSLITITSAFGSGGEKIAEQVSEELGFELFDDKKIQERAIELGFSSDDLDGIDEKAPRLFDRLFTNKPAKYFDLLGSLVYDISSKGEGVIIGHGAHVFLRRFHCALHVLIHASEETRSAKLAKEQGMSEDKAVELIRKMDKRLKDFVQYTFDRDWKDLPAYDLVFNLEKLEPERATRLIIELARSDEIKECSLKATEEMEFASLKYKVEAALIENNLIESNLVSPNTIFVEVTGRGKVHLSGWVSNDNDKHRMMQVVKKVPGVAEVTSNVNVMPYQDA